MRGTNSLTHSLTRTLPALPTPINYIAFKRAKLVKRPSPRDKKERVPARTTKGKGTSCNGQHQWRWKNPKVIIPCHFRSYRNKTPALRSGKQSFQMAYRLRIWRLNFFINFVLYQLSVRTTSSLPRVNKTTREWKQWKLNITGTGNSVGRPFPCVVRDGPCRSHALYEICCVWVMLEFRFALSWFSSFLRLVMQKFSCPWVVRRFPSWPRPRLFF